MFLGQAFTFRVILDLFDKKDGLRRLVNVVSYSKKKLCQSSCEAKIFPFFLPKAYDSNALTTN